MLRTLVIAWRAFLFYAKCIHWAADGTISRANATYGIIGVLIIYLAGLHWGLGTLTIPDNALSNVIFIIVALLVTSVAIFAIRLIGAPGKLYGDAQDEIKILSKQMTPQITVYLMEPNSGVQLVKTKLDTNLPGPDSKWLQIMVVSATNAELEDCAAHVTKIQRMNADRSVKELLFEPVFCDWSQLKDAERRRIKILPALVPQAANLFSINDNQARPTLYLHFNHRKFQLEDELQTPGKYKIEIVVSAKRTPSVKKHFLLDWDGSFANIEFSMLDD